MSNYERVMDAVKELRPYLQRPVTFNFGIRKGARSNHARADLYFLSHELADYWVKELGDREPAWTVLACYLGRRRSEDDGTHVAIIASLTDDEYLTAVEYVAVTRYKELGLLW